MTLPALLDATDRWVARIGRVAGFALIPALILVRLTEIYTRTIINAPSSIYNAMERELFSAFIFLVVGAVLVGDGHVRVDILRTRFPPRLRAWIEALGMALTIPPLALIVFWFGSDLVVSAIQHGERAAIFFGAPLRWVIVAMLPLGVGLLTLAALTRMTRAILFLTGRGPEP